ncbi:MAG: hypothetical protein IPN61_07510 [Bacteroidetes bacterium]|nr:hypothetical protein [Bacteroidota bacterium]
MNYYRLIDELYIPSQRWFLGSVNFDKEFDFWKYVSTGDVEIPKKELIINIREKGIPLNFTMADFELLIVDEKTLQLFKKDEVMSIPVRIEGKENNLQYYILVIKDALDCVDEEKSVFDKWQIGSSIRPDKEGQFKFISKLVINRASVIGKELFRVKGFNVIIVINEELKNKFETNKITGISFIKLE